MDKKNKELQRLWDIYNSLCDQLKLKNHFNNEDGLKEKCKAVRRAFLDATNFDLKAGDEKYKLTPAMVASTFRSCFHFYLLDKSENVRIAFYNPVEGIYSRNYRILKRYLGFFEPYLTENQANNAIYWLRNFARYRALKEEDNKYIAVGNGLFNLKTKKLEPFSYSHIILTKVNTNYVEGAKSPNIYGWTVDKMLDRFASGDQEEVKLFWQIINEALNGNRTRNKAFFLVGNIRGNNGKGTFQDMVQYLVGNDNVAHLKVDEFEKRFALQPLDGKTVCIGDDIQNGYIENTSNFNSVVTGDVVTIEPKMQPVYDTRLHTTIIQSCNTMPTFGKKGGTMRRLVLVPFKANFTGSNENQDVKNKYLKRQDVREYILYKALNIPDFNTFIEPAKSKALKQDFEATNDSYVAFKTDIFDAGKIDRIPTDVAFNWYKSYCTCNGYEPTKKPREFNRRMLDTLGNEYRKSKARLSENEKTKIMTFNRQCKEAGIGHINIQDPFSKPNPTCFIKE